MVLCSIALNYISQFPAYISPINLLMKYGKEIVALTSLMFINTDIYAAPTNEQLYLMILDLKKEVSESKTREKDLHANLDKANAELGAAKKQLGELPKTEPIVTAVKQLDEPKNESSKIPNTKEGFSVSAGAIYVKPVTSNSASGQIGNVPYSENISDSGINYGGGFQVSTGYQALNNWDYGLKFKHFKSSSNVTDSSGTYVSDLGAGQVGGVVVPVIGYTSNYNVLDLEIGKLFSLSDNVALRLSGGIRSAIMNESLNSSFAFSIPTTNPSSGPSVNGSANTKNDFWGIGPRVTASPTWKPFGNNFRVVGNVGTSFLMGQNNDSYSSSGSVNNVCSGLGSDCNDYPSSSTSSSKRESFATILEAGSGFGYTIKANLVDIDLQTGYQLEHWIVTDQTSNLIFRGYQGAYGTVAIKY
jgi:Legionella pneumophila major outer membrane protein precursor